MQMRSKPWQLCPTKIPAVSKLLPEAVVPVAHARSIFPCAMRRSRFNYLPDSLSLWRRGILRFLAPGLAFCSQLLQSLPVEGRFPCCILIPSHAAVSDCQVVMAGWVCRLEFYRSL